MRNLSSFVINTLKITCRADTVICNSIYTRIYVLLNRIMLLYVDLLLLLFIYEYVILDKI